MHVRVRTKKSRFLLRTFCMWECGHLFEPTGFPSGSEFTTTIAPAPLAATCLAFSTNQHSPRVTRAPSVSRWWVSPSAHVGLCGTKSVGLRQHKSIFGQNLDFFRGSCSSLLIASASFWRGKHLVKGKCNCRSAMLFAPTGWPPGDLGASKVRLHATQLERDWVVRPDLRAEERGVACARYGGRGWDRGWGWD